MIESVRVREEWSELSVDHRNKIIARHRSGRGYKNISKALSAPRSTGALIVKLEEVCNHFFNPDKLDKDVTKNTMDTLTELQMSYV